MASRMHKSHLSCDFSWDKASDTYSYHSDTPSLLSDLGYLGDLTLLGDLGSLGDDDLIDKLESCFTPIPPVPLLSLHGFSFGDNPDREVILGDLDRSLLTPRDVKCLSGKLEISSDYKFMAPEVGDSYHNPSAWYFTVTLAHVNSGLSIPPHSLLVETFDASLPPIFLVGLSVNMATLQAREDTMGRPPSTGEKKRVDDRRHPAAPRSSITTSGSHPQSGHGGRSSSQGRQGPHPMSTDSRAPGDDFDQRKDQCTRGHDDGKRKGEVATLPNFKKCHGDPISSSRGPQKNSLFLEGVNAKERLGSFCDTDDPDTGWRKGRENICDYDMAHLVPQTPAALSHSLALIGCQAVSLACAYQAREERGRAEDARFRRELSQLKEENELLRSEKMKFQDDLSCLTKKCEERTRDDEELRKELGSLYDKHHTEVKTGGMFLASKTGKSFVLGVEEKALAAFRVSLAFADEVYSHAFGLHDEVVRDCRRQLRLTGLVPEEVV
ncbi:uncharacterized protein LOC142554720 [Primulina tabacum]|uniref:uncharacterized protein LOC142554720 n=1 Tax=Primulina tabacum TaxID=48773 RepID=UPI003F596844